jgi:hypothetical protein
MVKFHHARRGRVKINIDNRELYAIHIIDKPMYFTRDENEIYFRMMAEAGKIEYGGFVHYQIDIPTSEMTDSINPTTKKILRMSKDVKAAMRPAVRQLMAERKKMSTGTQPPKKTLNISRDDIRAIIGPNVIGIDATEYPCFNAFTDELVLFEMPEHCAVIPVSYTKTPLN